MYCNILSFKKKMYCNILNFADDCEVPNLYYFLFRTIIKISNQINSISVKQYSNKNKKMTENFGTLV